jgi:DNA invertase Pin-like site-specific DNA recombinase
MTKPPEKSKVVRKLRCAVYTRKSSEEGLEQEFNSLHAQREACEAYIASQRSEGWVLVRDQYDDGGISGGTLERPGLKRLLEDIEDGLVDVVVVYKIDRLSRSLADFAKLVEVFDRNGVTFVSVTQSFNTTTSMGRLTLNILLSFAQFEREVTAERIRDKVAASRKKGMWMGGVPPYGYRVENRKLVVDEEAAAHVRWIFARFLEIGSCTELAREVGTRGIRTPRGNRIDKKYIYRMLSNRAYIGEAVHKGDSYPGEHDAIIDREVWDKVPRHPAGEPAQARRADPRRNARATEGAAVRTGWRGLLAHPHPQGRAALPLLCQPDGAEAWCRILPGRPCARRRDRGRCHRPATRGIPPAGDSGGHMEGSVYPRRRYQRSRRPDGTAANRSAVGRTLPRRAGAYRGAAGRARRYRNRGPERAAARRWPWRLRVRDAGGKHGRSGVTRATSIPDTVTLHVPLTLIKRGGRKEMQLPEGAEQTRRTDNTLIKALARAFRWKRMLETGDFMTITELAEREGVAVSYLTRVLRLTLLAPEITAVILDGLHGPELTLTNVTGPFPLEWALQRRYFQSLN